MQAQITSHLRTLLPLLLIAAVTACGGNGTNKKGSSSNPPAFASIPTITVSGLGQQISPVNLSQYESGGVPPFSYSIVTQTNSSTVDAIVSGSTISSDYAYSAGTNVVTVSVTDANKATAQTSMAIVVTVPTVAYKVMCDFSPYENGQDPNTGTTIGIDQIIQRMGAVAPYCSAIRSYGMTLGLENIPMVAHRFGLKSYAGAWISKDPTANGTELQNLITAAQQGYVDFAIVGSEVLLRNDQTPTQLVAYISQFRTAVPNVRVATADTWNVLLGNPSVVNASDSVLANYFPYWEGRDISTAVAYLNAEDILMRISFSGKEVIVSESGWPSCGNPVGSAVPSPPNAALYFLNFESWVQANQRKAFYFEVYDEAWKANYEGPQGACWGIFDQFGTIKSGMVDIFNGKTMPDNWSCNVPPGGDGTPSLVFTSVPAIGTTAPLLGQEWYVLPTGYYVAVYIHVGGGWWTKPYADQPQTSINCDGTWSTDITTGGNDTQADEITAFLLPNTYSPPILLGAAGLPPDLYANAVAVADTHR